MLGEVTETAKTSTIQNKHENYCILCAFHKFHVVISKETFILTCRMIPLLC